MKRWMTMAVVITVFAAPMARADEASKQAKVEELFAAMHMDHMMDQMMGLVTQQVEQTVKQMPGADQMTVNQRKLMDAYMAKVMKVSAESVGWKAIEPEYVKLYAATYTEAEIDGILTFYKSPAGQAMLAKTPELSAGAMKIVQERMVEFQPKLKEMQDEFMKEMTAKTPPPPAQN